MKPNPTAPRLTAADLGTIARAREPADTHGSDAFRRLAGMSPDSPQSSVHAAALGTAQFLLAELVALAERLAADTTPEAAK
jgi:hypothetical protein